MRSLVFVALLLASVSSLPLRYKGSTIYGKDLAGPPSQFAQNALPTPDQAAQFQSSAFLPLWINDNTLMKMSNFPQSVILQYSFSVDSSEEFQLNFLSPTSSYVKLALTDPNGKVIKLNKPINGVVAIGETTVPAQSWVFKNPVVGTYNVIIKSHGSEFTRNMAASNDLPFGYLIVLNKSPLTMVGHLSTYNMQQGQQIGLVASVVEANNNVSLRSLEPAAVRAQALRDTVFQATMDITLPDGTEEEVQMYDDGLHGDFEANDGVYGAQIPAGEVGTYHAQAVLKGTNANGVEFIRTTQHLIASVADDISFLGTATGALSDSEHMIISLGVHFNTSLHPVDQNFRGYAEVWGKDSQGNDAAACWIAGINQVTDGIFLLNLDLNWLSLSGVVAPLTLKNVLLQDIDSFVAVSTYTSMPVQTSASINARIVSGANVRVAVPTKEMKQGVLPAHFQAKKDAKAGVNGAIILVHGYCSGSNPFAANKGDWTNAYYFLNPSASNTHNDFSQLVLQYAEDNDISSYSIVGHSQGGMVSAHIKNYYFSGLDIVGSGKAMQSIGTPYEGCTAAGSAANLGDLFGVGCGTNFDLSVDGSKLWLPGITTDTRNDINYYTTTYELGTWFGDSCSMPMNAVLEWPNDGTAELDFTNIPGGVNMGNTQKQCHTTDMNYMAQYYDNSRNKKMNSAAAR